jgi:hypothetical protein
MEVAMFEDNNQIQKKPDNSKAGITVCLNQNENGGSFEAAVYFKKKGKNQDELRGEKAIVLTAGSKLRLDIGKNSYVEIFAERSNMLSEGVTDESIGLIEGESGDV